jgi:hypothetical protein
VWVGETETGMVREKELAKAMVGYCRIARKQEQEAAAGK